MSRAVLLVNENSDERQIYETGLAMHGFHVRSVDALDELRAAIDGRPADVIVLSLRLGEPATWAALDEFRCGGAFGIPGVLLTGSIREDASNRARARTSGCAAFVAKPCTPEALAAVLRAVIGGARGLVVIRPDEFTWIPPADPNGGGLAPPSG